MAVFDFLKKLTSKGKAPEKAPEKDSNKDSSPVTDQSPSDDVAGLEDTAPQKAAPQKAAPKKPAPKKPAPKKTTPKKSVAGNKAPKKAPENPPLEITDTDDAEADIRQAETVPETAPETLQETAPETAPETDVPPPADAEAEDVGISSAGAEPDQAEDEQPAPARKSWFGRLKDGLGKSASKITEGLAGIMGKPKLDAGDLEDIEDALIMADLGVAAAGRLTEGLKGRSYPDGVNAESLAQALAEEVATILGPVAKPLEIDPGNTPHVVLMVGVNGSGKTTTAGKLAEYWRSEGKTVMLAAADTFRAAAVEQLRIWGERTGTTVIAGEANADAAAVAYQAHERAIREKVDILIVDTAGRLQARAELMQELEKITRVLGKQDDTAPHDSIIVLDGTVGQNALSQVAAFQQAANLSGMIVTKLDGSARGGIVVALAEEFGLPIHAVGVGEGKEDLRPFDAADFGRALAGLGGS